MRTKEKTIITIDVVVNTPVETVWKFWTTPEDIKKWNNASDDWYTPRAENDFREGGKFDYRMEARDGSSGFNFTGIYKKVLVRDMIEYVIGDGRKVIINFKSSEGRTRIIESFEAEETNSVELQRKGWQSILDNFKSYAEANYMKQPH